MRIEDVHATLPPGDCRRCRRRLIPRSAPAGTSLTIRPPEQAPPSIASRYEDALAMAGVPTQGARGRRRRRRCGNDQLHRAETALEAAREAVRIFLLAGVSETALHLGAQPSLRFSAPTFGERIAPRFEAMAKAAGFADRLASRALGGDAADRARSRRPRPRRRSRRCRRGVGQRSTAPISWCSAGRISRSSRRRWPKGFRHRASTCQLIRPLQAGLHQATSLAAMGPSQSRLTYPLPCSCSPAPELEVEFVRCVAAGLAAAARSP